MPQGASRSHHPSSQSSSKLRKDDQLRFTLQGTDTYPTWKIGTSSSKSALVEDMLVPRRVVHVALLDSVRIPDVFMDHRHLGYISS